MMLTVNLSPFQFMMATEPEYSSRHSNYCAKRRWEKGSDGGFRGYEFRVRRWVGKGRRGDENEVLKSEEAFEIVKSAFLNAMPPCKDAICNSLEKSEE